MIRSRRRLVRIIAAALVAGAAGISAPGAQAQVGENEDRYTPLIPSVMSTPRWFEGTDDRAHLVYELQLVNGFPVPVTVTGVEVRDATDDRRIGVYSGGELTAATSLMASSATPETTIPSSATGVVWIDIPLASRRAIPARLEHTVTTRVPPGLPVPEVISVIGGGARVDRPPPVVIGAPLTGAGWAAIGSCCDGPHRRALQPVNGRLLLGQRFAIDFNRLDAQNRLVVGDPGLSPSYPTYGQPVLAVADAAVVDAVDRFSDQIPNAPSPVGLAEASGNHVVLRLARVASPSMRTSSPGASAFARASASGVARRWASLATRAVRAVRTCTSRSWTRPRP